MSIVLKSIELKNLRSHEHMRFEPSESGVTAISGPNGTGKSTIVDSIAWTLYGTKPSGVSSVKLLIRDGADLSKSECSSEMVLLVDGVPLKVHRRITTKTGQVQCTVEEQEENGSWRHEAGPAVSHAEKYIRRRLKMDEMGFLSAILVQQKQVDQLITASAKERAAFIEKLTGIASVTSGLEKARAEYSDLKKQSKSSGFDDRKLKSLQAEFETTEKSIETAKAVMDASQSKLNEASSEQERLSEELAEKEAIRSSLEEQERSIVEAKTLIASTTAEIRKLSTKKDEKKRQLSDSVGDVDELRAKLDDLRKQESTVHRKVGVLTSRRESLAAEVTELNASLANTEGGLKALRSNLAKYRRGLVQLSAEHDELKADIATLRASLRKLDAARKTIGDGEGACPTCLQEIADKDVVFHSLDDEKARVESDIKAKSEKLKELAGRIENGEKMRDEAAALVDSLSSLTEKETQLSELNESESNENAVLITLQKEIAAVDKVYEKAQKAASIRNDYDSTREDLVDASDRLEEYRKTLNSAEKATSELGNISSFALDSLRKKASAAISAYQKCLEKNSANRERHSVLENSLEHLTQRLAAMREQEKRHVDLLRQIEVSGNSVELLEEFRADRIRNSVPVVSSYASDLLSRFTDGVFTQLKLDSKFKATTTLATGQERPVALLSGGELSSAALALRLAINMLLTGGSTKSMLILDEVLVSQDSVRAEHILSALKEIFHGQIIIISHGPHTNDISDTVMSL